MRRIVLDTETTGLEPALGHRVIEIGAVEIVNRRITGRTYHTYLNPDREIDAGAIEVHGITNDFLTDKPRFRDVSADLLEFVAGAELIIHNAPFDVGFLNAELGRLDAGTITAQCASVLDTLKLAREMHPGQKNNLDALCRRYEIDNSDRSYHGALLDAQLLAEVYLAMTRGQDSLAIEAIPAAVAAEVAAFKPGKLHRVRVSAEELAEHAAYLEAMRKECEELTAW
jgi:DNA polymerase-3 subunit epsilon